jgi:hypothetical protein
MPPASPLASLAGWFVPLQAVLLYGAPVLVVAWLFVRRRDWTDGQLLRTMLAITAIYLLLAAFGWYVDRDYAASPLAAVYSTGVIVVPTLIAIGWVWRLAQRRAWNPVAKVGLPILAGYVVGIVSYLPALIAFIMLGGEQL